METQIHSTYTDARVSCATCGTEFQTRSTQKDIHVESCSSCHPFYIGRHKAAAAGGRIDRFRRRAAQAKGAGIEAHVV